MFLFISLLASSIDGFVIGFLLTFSGIKYNTKDYIKIYIIIFLSCFISSSFGKFISEELSAYIRLLGIFIMLFLGISSLLDKSTENKSLHSPAAIALTVSADAGIVCIYLGMCRYNLLFISFLCAVLHTVFIYSGNYISSRITNQEHSQKAKIISGLLFIAIAISRLLQK